MISLCSRHRKFLFISLVLICFSSAFFAFADNYGLLFKKADTFADRTQIYDADYLIGDEELLELYNKAIKPFADEYGTEVIIYLTKTLDVPIEQEKVILEAAYKNANCGIGKEKTGSIIYINYNTRRVRCSYFGELKDIYVDDAQVVAEDTTLYLKEGDTLGAVYYYLADLAITLKKLGKIDENGERIKPPFRVSLFKFFRNIWIYIASAVLAGAITFIKLRKYKGKITVNEYTYADDSAFVLGFLEDNFYNTVTTRTRIQKSSSSSGGGGGGSSSSGGASF